MPQLEKLCTHVLSFGALSALKFISIGTSATAFTLAAGGFAQAALAQSLDGAYIEAADGYKEPKRIGLNLNAGVYPFNAYFNGFTVGGALLYHFGRSVSWEIAQGSFIFPVQTGLTSELAEKWNVNPIKIRKTKYSAATNILYTIAYGKMLLLDNYVRQFRLHALIGPGFMAYDDKGYFAASYGLRLETYVKPSLAWTAAFRSYLLPTNKWTNHAEFSGGVAIGF